MSNQLTPIQACTNFVQGLEQAFIEVSKENHTNLVFKKESQFALQVLRENDYLLKIAQQNPESLKSAIVNIGAIGLTLNPVQKLAYLIPRKGKVCLDVSYMGLVDIACNTGSIRFVQAKIVHEKDDFEYQGISREPCHSFNPFKDRGPMVGAYCLVKTSDGDFLTETMTLEEIHKIRDRSESWKRNQTGPWATDFSEMSKKSIIRRSYKLWPKTTRSIQVDNAVNLLNEVEGIDFKEEEKEQSQKEAVEIKLAVEKQRGEAKKIAENKQEIIDEIARIASEKCKGLSPQEKGLYMVNTMKINSFNELNNKTVKDLEGILNAVDWSGNE